MRERVPWDPERTSLDNVYSGLLVHLHRLAGGDADVPRAATTPAAPSPFPCDDPTISTLSCGSAFLRRWFRVAMPLLLSPGHHRCPASKADAATARDNFVLAASIAAGRDLCAHFASELRWPVGERIAPAAVGGGGLSGELVATAEAAAPWPATHLTW
jgi:hypothetical protein